MTSETRSKIKTHVIDRGLAKLISRKLLVWIVGTAGVPLGLITSEQWLNLSMVYIGSQAAQDFLVNVLRARSGSLPDITPGQ